MKKKLILLLTLLIAVTLFAAPITVFAEGDDGSDVTDDLQKNVEEILDRIDTAELDAFIASLDENQKSVFGSTTLGERLKKIISGELKLDYSSFFGYVLEVIGVNFLQYLPLIISILVISIVFNIISSIKGRFASDSVESIVHFANVAIIVVLVLSQVILLITTCMNMITSMRNQMNMIFPIILTMMAASGGSASVAVYQPSVAILASGVTELVSIVILPCFILSCVFTVVGSISEGVKLKKMSSFFSGASKWLLGTVFFLFIAFLSIQGITASVYDGVSVRTAKFAISKYVPIIGGYLSEGLNLVMAGSVLVKNAVGMTAVVLLLLSLVPIVMKIIIFNLSLSLTSAIVEPLGNTKISALLSDLSKNMGMLVSIVLGTAFLYFIFLILVVSTGNLVL